MFNRLLKSVMKLKQAKIWTISPGRHRILPVAIPGTTRLKLIIFVWSEIRPTGIISTNFGAFVKKIENMRGAKAPFTITNALLSRILTQYQQVHQFNDAFQKRKNRCP